MFSFDLSMYFTAAVGGVPILFVIIGLVEVVKALKVPGSYLRPIAMLFGLVFGVMYQFAELGAPAEFAGYFAYAIYGLGLGVLAFMGYDLMVGIVTKAVAALAPGGSGPGDDIGPPDFG